MESREHSSNISIPLLLIHETAYQTFQSQVKKEDLILLTSLYLYVLHYCQRRKSIEKSSRPYVALNEQHIQMDFSN